MQIAQLRLRKQCALHCPRPCIAPNKVRGGEAKVLDRTVAPGALLTAEWFDLVGFSLIAGRRRWLGRGIERRDLPCHQAAQDGADLDPGAKHGPVSEELGILGLKWGGLFRLNEGMFIGLGLGGGLDGLAEYFLGTGLSRSGAEVSLEPGGFQAALCAMSHSTPPLYPLYSPSKPLVINLYFNRGGLQGVYNGCRWGLLGN